MADDDRKTTEKPRPLQVVSPARMEAMGEAVEHYGRFIDRAEEYLATKRALTVADAREYRLGVVELKYRCTEDHDCGNIPTGQVDEDGEPITRSHGKYLYDKGAAPNLYNVNAFLVESDTIVLTEGEFDALAVEVHTGLPAVGYPGTSTWRSSPWWKRCFDGYATVFVAADGDKPGADAAKYISRDLPNAVVVSMPEGHDATSYIIEHGPEAMLAKFGFNYDA